MQSKFTFPTRERCLRIGRNALIVALGFLMLADGFPGTPEFVRAAVNPLVRAIGIQQSHWHLFSPTPDQVNMRLEGRLYYADGTRAEWISPDWRDANEFEHFRGHRLAKFYDNVRNPGYAAAWPAFTEHVLRQVAKRDGRTERPVRFELRVLEGQVPDPRFYPWPPAAEPTPLNNRWTLYETEAP